MNKFTITPLIRQYKRLKQKEPDAILFFRVGDFYETFYEDAVLTSKTLGIALTQRQEGVPLAGVPHHSAKTYIQRLVSGGYKVAICEQLEEPKPGKLVERDIMEVITQGTVLDDMLLDEKKTNFLASIYPGDNRYGLALLDISTGDFRVTELTRDELLDEIRRLEPKEIIIPSGIDEIEVNNIAISRIDDFEFDYEYTLKNLLSHFGIQTLDGFGCGGMREGIQAAGAALFYAKRNKRKDLSYVERVSPYSRNDSLVLDEPTRRNLELVRKPTGETDGTLLSILDNTTTPMGGRLLRDFLISPLLNPEEIRKRQDKVGVFYNNPSFTAQLRGFLSQIPDLDRLITRLSLERVNARDVLFLGRALKKFPEINRFLPDSLSSYKLGNFDGVVEEIEKTIVESPPQTIKEGGIIRSDVNKELDELRNISKNVKLWIADFENTERQRTGIGSLKVGFNSVFGYYIEVTRPNLPKVPEEYVRKQTLANAERFITPQLKEYEAKVLQADERSRLLEYEIFKELRDRLKNFVPSMKEASTKIAYIDVLSTLASIARRYGYTRPVVDDEDRIVMKDSRHPVVERLPKEGEFIPNDVKLDLDERVLVITGPNMAGKSTYLRQVALCVILAQMGSYIPAMEAKIGIVDRIFTRIGASDDLTKGVSTFLAEMTETANILNNATRRSLLILDEIGRGTSTYDGLSIAWASVEYIVKNTKAKTLFATHYHELTELERLSDEIKNYNLECKKWKDKIIFLRKVVRGGCPQSYGIEVAKLAGLPKDVIERAKRILVSLEREERRGSSERLMQPLQLGIFDEVKESEVERELKNIDIEKLTPIDALLILKSLKDKIKETRPETQDQRPQTN